MGDRMCAAKYLGIQPVTKVNSAFHPFGVDKSSTGLWLGWGVFICVEWQVTLCDPIMASDIR